MTKQSGNVVILILVAVGLFGALAYTFMRGSEQGQGNLTSNQARIAAQEIINYAGIVEKSIGKVRSRGCSENQISFETSGNTGYTNAGTSDDCRLFDSQSGGQLTWQTPQDSWLNASYTAQPNYGQFFFSGSNLVPGVGTAVVGSGNDLVMLLLYLSKEVCLEINNFLGVPNPSNTPPNEGTNVSIFKFQGAFTTSPGALWDSNTGVQSACLRASDANPPSGSYFYFHVLLAR